MSRDAAALAGRVLLGLLLVLGAAQKLADPGPAADLLAMRGLPGALLWPALLFNLVAGPGIVLGVWTRPLALLSVVYCAATSIFHLQPDDPWQITIFVKNWTIAGGFLMLYAHGPGAWALRRDA